MLLLKCYRFVLESDTLCQEVCSRRVQRAFRGSQQFSRRVCMALITGSCLLASLLC